jgi:tRNA-modifying protein YgfZ
MSEILTPEYTALRNAAGVIDFSSRGRICLTGADRVRFLHGQVTNDVKKLSVGEGCYAALVTAKGKMESDLNVFCLQDELLLDFEPGLAEKISQRLEKFIVADDVQIVDVAPLYGLLSVQGPKSDTVVSSVSLFSELPEKEFHSKKISNSGFGEVYVMNHPRLGSAGFDLFVPNDLVVRAKEKLVAAAKRIGGCECNLDAFETARIEAGIPRFGADMDDTNIPIECGIESRAISYSKGCYIGQEVLNRIHTMGHVTRELRRLQLAETLSRLPMKGDKLFHDGKEAGYITSATKLPGLNKSMALGYVRREALGQELNLRSASEVTPVVVTGLPFSS